MSDKAIRVFFAVALVAAIAATAAWYQGQVALRELRMRVVVDQLQPIAVLLEENREIVKELQAEASTEKDSGILESYLMKIRRDGVPKNARFKQRLDQVAENNTAIVTLIKTYSPHAKTATLSAEADKFQHYAVAWRDRWNSVMELFMAGGNYPAAEVPFPKELLSAMDAEIDAAKHAF
jgi:hypothetical protein